MESNQGHMDFQSIALPPELRYLYMSHSQPLTSMLTAVLLKCECKVNTFLWFTQIFPHKLDVISEKRVIFASSFKGRPLRSAPKRCSSGCSAVGSALRSGRRGRAFESPHPDQHRGMYRMVHPSFYMWSLITIVVPPRGRTKAGLSRKRWDLIQFEQQTTTSHMSFNRRLPVSIDAWHTCHAIAS